MKTKAKHNNTPSVWKFRVDSMNASQLTDLRNKWVTEIKKKHREFQAHKEQHFSADKSKQLSASQVGDTVCIKRPPLAHKNNVKIETHIKIGRNTLTVKQVCSKYPRGAKGDTELKLRNVKAAFTVSPSCNILQCSS